MLLSGVKRYLFLRKKCLFLLLMKKLVADDPVIYRMVFSVQNPVELSSATVYIALNKSGRYFTAVRYAPWYIYEAIFWSNMILKYLCYNANFERSHVGRIGEAC